MCAVKLELMVMASLSGDSPRGPVRARAVPWPRGTPIRWVAAVGRGGGVVAVTRFRRPVTSRPQSKLMAGKDLPNMAPAILRGRMTVTFSHGSAAWPSFTTFHVFRRRLAREIGCE